MKIPSFQWGRQQFNLAIILFAFLFSTIVVLALIRASEKWFGPSLFWKPLALCIELGLFLGLCAAALLPQKLSLGAIWSFPSRFYPHKLHWKTIALLFLVALLLRYGMAGLVAILGLYFEHQSIDDALRAIAGADSIQKARGLLWWGLNLPDNVFSILFFSPMVEEFIYRGVLLNYLLLRFRPNGAVIASALFFGLCHIFSPTACLAGIVLGYAYLWFGLAGSIVMHSAFNFVALLMRYDSKFIPLLWISDTPWHNVLNWLLSFGCITLLVVVLVGCWRFAAKHSVRSTFPPPASKVKANVSSHTPPPSTPIVSLANPATMATPAHQPPHWVGQE